MMRLSWPVKQWVRMSPGRISGRISASVGGPAPMWTISGSSTRSAGSRARAQRLDAGAARGVAVDARLDAEDDVAVAVDQLAARSTSQ